MKCSGGCGRDVPREVLEFVRRRKAAEPIEVDAIVCQECRRRQRPAS